MKGNQIIALGLSVVFATAALVTFYAPTNTEATETVATSHVAAISIAAPERGFLTAAATTSTPLTVEVEQTPIEPTPPTPLLTGIIHRNGQPAAMLALPGGSARLYAVGERIGAWTVRSIDDRAAALHHGENRVSLTLYSRD